MGWYGFFLAIFFSNIGFFIKYFLGLESCVWPFWRGKRYKITKLDNKHQDMWLAFQLIKYASYLQSQKYLWMKRRHHWGISPPMFDLLPSWECSKNKKYLHVGWFSIHFSHYFSLPYYNNISNFFRCLKASWCLIVSRCHFFIQITMRFLWCLWCCRYLQWLHFDGMYFISMGLHLGLLLLRSDHLTL